MEKASPQTNQLATQKNAVRLNQPVLLGIFGSTAAPRAMIRYPNGRIDTVRPGDKTRLGQVVAIGEDVLHVARNGRTEVLRLPQPGEIVSSLRPHARPSAETNAA
ncbi:hypothetical protein JQX09_04955 [Sulfitobacter pseudonitzschiae]|uniref:Pilus assembly protein PilZ n=1 Tax=Pseudosulfitobacter pseudonitzschiae TaxID=1402135 RepID=A0A9Q2NZN6_9RHOB|nr:MULTISPECIES: hypothetical protein [Roseobacteraceae]MBM2291243.1 hypothetical protein [Pseudosulfitobacter pseudonitzschiae]MBM2296161.1 hypothetical protein [Pseudosulfitobacter pseudonitzschiae]MBM2301074.1 hypothetical protein [Pseudosulfitobacter pseudonitzschiae]MBM2310858.1 hypothetical protein [Pseudosulfitobacter pseudonitzschiae]MBM2315771.1 hypothetical protein [Pseudosulfitobacter pseudonitzschiae]|tara:strand:+ start:242 stop:556 length:315 start_codon:yes stop_codon:yes gene_type:complete